MIEKKMSSGITDFSKYPKPIIADAFVANAASKLSKRHWQNNFTD